MRLTLSLCLLSMTGILLPILPPDYVRLQVGGTAGFSGLWYGSVTAFAVPLCLAILRFAKLRLLLVCSALWGGWMVLSSFWVLLQSTGAFPAAPFNTLMIGFVMVFSLSVTLFSVLELVSKAKKSTAEKEKTNESPALEKAETASLQGAEAPKLTTSPPLKASTGNG